MRRAAPADAPAMALAHVDSIRSLGPTFYAADLVDGWSAAVTTDMYVRAMAQGATAITIEASLAGLAFYRALGLVEIGPCDVRLGSGASIPCVAMRKQLAGAGAE